jgi:hypothetical protein
MERGDTSDSGLRSYNQKKKEIQEKECEAGEGKTL